MQVTFWRNLIGIALTVSILDAAPDPQVPTQILDFTAGDSLPQQRAHDWTLGPTGARGWVQVSKGVPGGTTAKARQIYITQVAPQSPAAKVLKKGDIILGVEGEKFTSDARVAFAKTIQKAETSDGQFKLIRWREGKTSAVTIPLTQYPAFSATAPYDCPKSARILKEGCDILVKRGLGQPDIDSNINALALLSTGDAAYLPAVKAHAQKIVTRPLNPEMGMSCWYFGYANLFLTEYYLATKDVTVLPEIQNMTEAIVAGQGPLGTWGHRFKRAHRDHLEGYGAVNSIGVPCLVSMVLARESGVQFDGLDDAIELAARFFRRHVNLGSIPYGDGAAQTQYGHDDNGKNSTTAILYALLGEQEPTEYYVSSAIASHNLDREQGHTGNFFNILWAMPAVSLAGPEASGAWMREFGWYFDLARDDQLKFPYQGYPLQRGNSPHHQWDTPGLFLLSFAAPLKKLRMTGRGMTNLPTFTKAQIEDRISANFVQYQKASVEELARYAGSWSPVVRKRALGELRKRSASTKIALNFNATQPLDRIAAINLSKDFKGISGMLTDSVLSVRVAALSRLIELDKMKGVEVIFYHLADHPEETPAFTQMLGEKAFNLKTSTRVAGQLLSYPKDRKKAITAITRLIQDEDALIASRVAMGLISLPDHESKPLLPALSKIAMRKSVGNIMFSGKLQLSATEVMSVHHLSEGLDAAVFLLADDSWGRSSRLKEAARLLLKYQGHARSVLPQLRKGRKAYKPGDKWGILIDETIEKIEKAPTPRWNLQSLK